MAALIAQRNRGNDPWSLTASQIHFVPLSSLPDGLVFPLEHADHIWLESGKRQLAYRGFMSKSTYDRLSRLHGDPQYQRALSDLFQQCSCSNTSRSGDCRAHWLVGAVVTGLIAGSVVLLLRQ